MNITFCHVYAISDPGNIRYTGVLPLFKGRALQTEKGVRLYVRDLLGVNSDVTMHIISSLSSMDEANRLFAISGCGGK